MCSEMFNKRWTALNLNCIHLFKIFWNYSTEKMKSKSHTEILSCPSGHPEKSHGEVDFEAERIAFPQL